MRKMRIYRYGGGALPGGVGVHPVVGANHPQYQYEWEARKLLGHNMWLWELPVLEHNAWLVK